MATSRLQACLVFTKKVYLARKVLLNFIKQTLSKFNLHNNLRKVASPTKNKKTRPKIHKRIKKRRPQPAS